MKRKSIAHRFLFRLCPSHRFLIAFPLLLVVNAAQSASANAPQTTREGKVTRENFDLYYTIVGSGGVYVDNQKSRLGPCETEVIQYWSEASHRAANFERAEFERVRATAPAYFFDRKAALQFEMELTPDEFNPRVTPAYIEAAGAFDLRPQLKQITAPVLLLQGRQDLAGEANICEAHLLIKNSVLKFIDKCGHMPWLEQPEQTWKILNEFLRTVP